MKIVCISDTHRYHRDMEKLEKADLLIFAGDCMGSGFDEEELMDFLDWFELQPALYKVMIAGNHDRWIENNPEDFKELMKDYSTIIYLEDEAVTIKGFKIYGTPHSKIFNNWAFNRSEQHLQQLFDKIPNDTDILISHAPQYLVLDELIDGENVGENTLSLKLTQLKNLKLHVFGHIHNAFGMIRPHGKHISVNACQVNEAYDLANFPVIINL